MNNNRIWEFKKKVLPQHTDHAGVMWHGAYLNWLEEARIDSLSKVGLNYIDLLSKGYEIPVYNIKIKYLIPINIGELITIKSIFMINKGPRIKITSKFYSKEDLFHTEACCDLVLINKETFKAVRQRPEFLTLYFYNLKMGPNFGLIK
tara:strand:- start:8 stop:451 length:444 start_codon:yes stop_codon:yes gene_type:complete